MNIPAMMNLVRSIGTCRPSADRNSFPECACLFLKRTSPRYRFLIPYNSRQYMVYNPDEQDWDDTSLAMGREVYDVFCPYHDASEIQRQLKKLKVA